MTFEDHMLKIEPAIENIAENYARIYHADIDDLLQEGRLAAWKAWLKFDKSLSSFKNWALAKDAPERVMDEAVAKAEEKQQVEGPCHCHAHATPPLEGPLGAGEIGIKPERDDMKEVLPERKDEAPESTKKHPIKQWFKKIGIMK